jgi:hypothetical protein
MISYVVVGVLLVWLTALTLTVLLRDKALLCKHRQWKVTDVSYTQPLPFKDVYDNARWNGPMQAIVDEMERNRKFAEKMSKGFTYVTQKCTNCGLVKAEEFSGIRNIKVDEAARG